MESFTKEVPNDETIRAIENARNGLELSKLFSTVEDLMNDLNKDSDIELKVN